MNGSGLDFGGARGSNAGDVFHELWAVRHALRLLNTSDDLTAVRVEGIRAPGIADREWDGVDCTLFFGSDDVGKADRVEIQQLKYSGANPNKKWTVARACAGKNGTTKGSLVRKLGTAFEALIKSREGKQLDTIKISLVTNQPVSSELIRVIESAHGGVPASFNGPWKTGGPKLHRLVLASGLDANVFSQFASVMDFQGETGSRFAIEEGVLREIAQWRDTEFKGVALRLRDFVRSRMLPEAANEPITRERVLLQFDVSDERALFPCPSSFKAVKNAVSRQAARDVARAVTEGTRRICLHGGAGVGKTTVLQEIEGLLPDGSVMIAFDCYGAGSYQDASRLRHRPREAFVQLSNEISQRLGLPALLVPGQGQDIGRAFRQRLELAAGALARVCADGLLVLAIDAADHSIMAAEARGRAENNFVTELMSMRDLPANVRVIVSARTGRLDELNAPPEYRAIELHGFAVEETAANVARYWDAPSEWIEDFHSLSNGTPRVQGYVFRQAGDDCRDAIKYLMPSGKSLGEVFGELFDRARSKVGEPAAIKKLCAGLTVLPRPIPVVELAHATDVSEWVVRDMCSDLAPGIRMHEGFIGFTDEDFEAHVLEEGSAFEQRVRIRSAERFLENAQTDEYAAFNVADQLLVAEKFSELLSLVEQEPEPTSTVMPDPVLRHEVRNRRLLAAVRVCREAGNVARAMRFVLIAGEAVGSSEATRTLLAAYPRLTARFARDAGSRLILENPDHVSDHGRLLFCCLAEDSASGDRVALQENGSRLRAWLETRDDPQRSDDARRGRNAVWSVSGEDVAASVLATAIMRGTDAAIAHLEAWEPFEFRVLVGRAFVERLLAENKFEIAEEVAEFCRPWQSAFVLVPLARAGRDFDPEQLASSVTGLKQRFSLDADLLNRSYAEDEIGPYAIDTALSAAELLSAHDSYRELVLSIVAPFLDRELRRIDKCHEYEVALMDAILRAYCLREALEGNDVDASSVLVAAPEPGDDGRTASRRRRDDGRCQRTRNVISAITETYAHRAAIMAGAGERERGHIELTEIETSFNGWRLEPSRYASRYRAVLGERLTDLIAVGADAKEIMTYALRFRRGFWSEGPDGVNELCHRLSAIPLLHDELISKISDASTLAAEERIRANDKMRTLAAYASLLVPISPEDAKSVFGMAAKVASELDFEAMHQIRLLERLIENGGSGFEADERALARMAAEFVGDAAIRLGDQDHFPWDEAMTCIAQLDVPVALASVARWDDSGIESASMTLSPVVEVGLRQQYFNAAHAAGLIALDSHPPMELLSVVLDKAKRDGGVLVSQLAEEFAHDSVVGRIPFQDSLEQLVSPHGNGYWTAALQARADFLRRIETTATPREREDFEKEYAEFFAQHTWDASRLVVADTLLMEVEAVLEDLRSACGFGSLGRVLDDARDAVPPGKRADFLNALAQALEHESDDQYAVAILDAAHSWKGQFAVREWCKAKLPGLLARHLPTFARYLPLDDTRISRAIDFIVDSDGDPVPSLLAGLEGNVESMDAETIFGVVGLIGSLLKPAESAELSEWYIDRLFAKVPERDRESIKDRNIPVSASEAIARFHYAYMSDVDLRQRWRAAHALRRLARLGDESTVGETLAQYERMEEPAFRAIGQPFYWLAARLWMVMALDRIAGESVKVVESHGQQLLEICFSEEFPHLLVRDFAADACRKMVANGHLRVSAAQETKLESVNRGQLADTPRTIGREHSGSLRLGLGQPDRSKERFRFDPMDTLPYWYDGWLNVFEGLTADGFLRLAEEWIVDRWGVTEQPSRSSASRRNRFSDRTYSLWSHGHGRLPTLESYQTHLEWHAMWCVAGQLLESHRVLSEEFGDLDALTYEVSGHKLTQAPYWLSDLVSPSPLQAHRRRATDENLADWLYDVVDDDYLKELFPDDREGWVCVSLDITSSSYDRYEEVEIHTGLVNPGTGGALVRALQTARSHHQYYLGAEGHESEIEESPYELRGWLTGGSGELRFDKKDAFCGAGGSLQGFPGKAVRRTLGLEERFCNGRFEWFRKGAESPSFIYEAWGPREKDGWTAGLGDPPTFCGYRLLVKKDDLAEFLQAQDRDLIAEVGITRNERREYRPSFDAENSGRGVFDRVVLLRRTGALEAAERSLEAWRSDCP